MITLRAALFALLFSAAAAAQAVDVWGTVVWKTGAPAAGIELRLLKRGYPESAHILTNSAGRYGLYRLSTPTTDYALQVMSRGAPAKTVNLPPLRNGDRIPNIVMP
jgi:hypothetical protein